MEENDKKWFEYQDNEVVRSFNELSRSNINDELKVELEDAEDDTDSATIHQLTETAYYTINKEKENDREFVSYGAWSNKNNN